MTHNGPNVAPEPTSNEFRKRLVREPRDELRQFSSNLVVSLKDLDRSASNFEKYQEMVAALVALYSLNREGWRRLVLAKDRPRLELVEEFSRSQLGTDILGDLSSDGKGSLIGPVSSAITKLESITNDPLLKNVTPGELIGSLLEAFAHERYTSKTEYFTPYPVQRIMGGLAALAPSRTVYNPCNGSGELLVAAAEGPGTERVLLAPVLPSTALSSQTST